MMGLSDRLNPTCLLNRDGGERTHAGLSGTFFFFHMTLVMVVVVGGAFTCPLKKRFAVSLILNATFYLQ